MILVTGGTGLVGTHLLLALTKKGEKVRAIKRSASNTKLVNAVFNFYEKNGDELFSKIEWFDADINDILSLEDALEGIKRVYHCAAIVSFDPWERDLIHKINVEGTANVVNACLDAGIEKLCYVSSTAAIGRNKDATEIITEKTQWKNTPDNSWYAISKYNAEREVWRGIEEGLPAVIVNPCVIIGPSNWNVSSSAMFKAASAGIKYHTVGGNAFVDVRDVASSMVFLMNSEITSERYLITSENLPFKKLFEILNSAFGKKTKTFAVGKFLSALGWRLEKFKCRFTKGKPRLTKETAKAAQETYTYDNSKIKKTSGIEFISVEEAVTNAVSFYKNSVSSI